MRYEWWEIPASVSSYIDHVEYDTVYDVGRGNGARLYLRPAGRDLINSKSSGSYILSLVTDYVTSRSEWRSDRSYVSIATEIAVHCEAAKIYPSKVYPTHIEYFYNDLQWWEKPIYGR